MIRLRAVGKVSQNNIDSAMYLLRTSITVNLSADKKLKNTFDFIYNEYKISKNQLILQLGQSVTFNRDKDGVTIMISQVAKVDGIPVSLLADLITYGNLTLPGNNSIRKSFEQTSNSIRLFKFIGD